ncbi:hypothetical protein Tco_0607173 [Tanacetum coccineum]
MNEMVRNQLEVATMQVNVQFLQQLQPEWSRFVIVVKQTITRNANLVDTAQQYPPDNYYHAPKPHKNQTTSSRHTSSTSSHAPTKTKGKEVSKPKSPPSLSVSKDDSDPEQAQRDKDMQKNSTLRTENDRQTRQFGNQRTVTVAGAKETECRKPKWVKDYSYHKEKRMLCKQEEKGMPLSTEQSDWLHDTDEDLDDQELEAHYMYMEKIQEVLPVTDDNSGPTYDTEPLEQIVLIRDAYELKRRFLDYLRKNAYSGTNGEDAVEHIEYFLKSVDPIDLPNVNYERLRLAVFRISLVGNASKWFDEFKGSITTLVDLTKKFFRKYYPPSGTSNVVEANNEDEHEIAEIFRIETNLFDYETPLCTKFNELNYLLNVDTELFTQDIERTKTYEEYENELNNDVDEPWSENGVPYEICDHICEPFHFKSGKTKWPTCNSNEDGFCNGGELSGMVRVGYMTYFQDDEWYDDLTDSNLKD